MRGVTAMDGGVTVCDSLCDSLCMRVACVFFGLEWRAEIEPCKSIWSFRLIAVRQGFKEVVLNIQHLCPHTATTCVME